MAGTGCESLQRKFTRKPKQAPRPPTPIISFQDYSGAMTPLERYRKHYLMFDYWNQDFLAALQGSSPNAKRYRRASEEAIGELQTMRSLLSDDLAGRLGPLIEERATIDRAVHSPILSTGEISGLARSLEAQSRQIHREFFWRDVQEQLKPRPADAHNH